MSFQRYVAIEMEGDWIESEAFDDIGSSPSIAATASGQLKRKARSTATYVGQPKCNEFAIRGHSATGNKLWGEAN